MIGTHRRLTDRRTLACACFERSSYLCQAGVCLKQEWAILVLHFGNITGIVREPGCHCINPMGREVKWCDLREKVLETSDIKCLDASSNPVVVGGACYYKVEGVRAALMEVQR